VKKSQATIAWAWFLTKVDQRREEAPRGPPVQRRYLWTVRGETRTPSFN